MSPQFPETIIYKKRELLMPYPKLRVLRKPCMIEMGKQLTHIRVRTAMPNLVIL